MVGNGRTFKLGSKVCYAKYAPIYTMYIDLELIN